MTLRFRVNLKGHLERTCNKGNIEYKNCIYCPDILTTEPRGGGMPPSKIWCRGSGIEDYTRTKKVN